MRVTASTIVKFIPEQVCRITNIYNIGHLIPTFHTITVEVVITLLNIRKTEVFLVFNVYLAELNLLFLDKDPRIVQCRS